MNNIPHAKDHWSVPTSSAPEWSFRIWSNRGALCLWRRSTHAGLSETTIHRVPMDTRLAREWLTIAGLDMTYPDVKAHADAIHAENGRLSDVLNAFPKGEMGLTPDHVRATPEWRAAKLAFDLSFAELRAFNAWFTKEFRGELHADRAAQRARVQA